MDQAPDDLALKIYWAKRDRLEEEITKLEATLAVEESARQGSPNYIKELNDRISQLRATRGKLGNQPGPRPGDCEAAVFDSIRIGIYSAALNGVLVHGARGYEDCVKDAVNIADKSLVALGIKRGS